MLIEKDFFCVVIISDGQSEHFDFVLSKWSKEFELGKDLFICAPKDNLIKKPLFYNNKTGIIHFETEPGRFFNINEKKLFAGMNVPHSYIFFVHDRFYPESSIKNTIISKLKANKPDYAAVDILNRDGSVSLRELRLRKNRLGLNALEGISLFGRSVCDMSSDDASDVVAINGGEFILNKSCLFVLEKPMHWSEMEDDVMSIDLQYNKGLWFEEPKLTTFQFKRSKEKGIIGDSILRIKIRFYAIFCSLIKAVFSLKLSSYHFISIGESVTCHEFKEKAWEKFFIVDPAHKSYSAGFYFSPLEKIMSMLRLITNGDRDFKVKKVFLGWIIV